MSITSQECIKQMRYLLQEKEFTHRMVMKELKTSNQTILKYCGDIKTLGNTSPYSNFRKYPINRHFFNPLTITSAWVLGLIFGDGNISKRGSRICIATGNYEFAEQIKNVLGMGQINFQKNSKGTSYLVIFYSSIIMDELKEIYGLCPVKSKIMRFPVIPDNLLSHFVRGLSDSDGCFSINKRSLISPLRWNYASMSLEFVTSLQEILIANCGINNVKITKTKNNAHILEYAHKGAKAIGEWIYADSIETIREANKYHIFLKSSGKTDGKF